MEIGQGKGGCISVLVLSKGLGADRGLNVFGFFLSCEIPASPIITSNKII